MCNVTITNQEPYAKLRGKIREVFGTQEAFAKALHLSSCTISMKLNERREWSRRDIEDACVCLGIPIEEAHEYFF